LDRAHGEEPEKPQIRKTNSYVNQQSVAQSLGKRVR
jgi:hypothetical protein